MEDGPGNTYVCPNSLYTAAILFCRLISVCYSMRISLRVSAFH
jgi:hypothetical protein